MIGGKKHNQPNKKTRRPAQKKVSKQRALRGVWQEQFHYAIRGMLNDVLRQPLATLLTVTVIAISLTLPSLCFMVWKNINKATLQWYPSPQITVYLAKSLDDGAADQLVNQIKSLNGVDNIAYLNREEALNEFRNWSGFGGAMDMLEQNPLPAVVVITPKLDSQKNSDLNKLKAKVKALPGVDEVKMDDSWFARLSALTQLVAQVAMTIGILMIVAVFLVIGNSVRSVIFARRDSINVQKLIGATDGFIIRPFVYGGALLGFSGAVLSLILSAFLIFRLEAVVVHVASVFSSQFELQGLSWDEALFLLLVAGIIGWLAAWLTTLQHLRRFTPD